MREIDNHSKRVKTVFSAVLTLFVLFAIWFQAEGIEGRQDSWNHYLYGKYALKHPELFLDQWGKPLVVFLTFPFCLMGYQAFVAFNIACTFFSGYFTYKAVQNLGMRLAHLAFPIVCLTPILAANTISCLTEPLNAFAISLFLYLFSTSKHNASIVLASFFPYIRSEGYIILFVIFIFLLFRKEFKKTLLLSIGTIVVAIVGSIITKDWLYLIHSNPYIKAQTEKIFVAEAGPLLHYIFHRENIWGEVGFILFSFGLLLNFIKLLKNKLDLKSATAFELYIAGGISILYIVVHSVIYWKSAMGSHGLIRVMAVIAPLTGLLILRAWEFIALFFRNFKLILLVEILAIGVSIVEYKLGNNYPYPWELTEVSIPSEPGVDNYKRAAEWVKSKQLDTCLIVHQIPYFNVILNKDPWNINQTLYIWSIDKKNDWLPEGSIILYDGYYSSREGNTPINFFYENTKYQYLTSFEYTDALGERHENFDIYIFLKNNK